MEVLCDYCVYIFVSPQNMPLFPYMFATKRFINFESKQIISNNILSRQPLYPILFLNGIKIKYKMELKYNTGACTQAHIVQMKIPWSLMVVCTQVDCVCWCGYGKPNWFRIVKLVHCRLLYNITWCRVLFIPTNVNKYVNTCM